MILKYIYLTLNSLEYPDEISLPFSFYTRYVCNFLERKIRALKYRADGFDRICVEGRTTASDACEIVPDHALVAPVAFDEQSYRALRLIDRHEFFLEMLTAGLRKCDSAWEIPIDTLLAGIQEFREGGYRNEWTHQTKSLRPLGLRASLLCAMTSERFSLRLRLERRGEVVFDQEILETEPDEIIYSHKFKDVTVCDGKVVVTNRFGRAVVTVDPEDMIMTRSEPATEAKIPTRALELTEAIKLVSTVNGEDDDD